MQMVQATWSDSESWSTLLPKVHAWSPSRSAGTLPELPRLQSN